MPPAMAATMQHYLGQITVTLRPGTVKNAELTLREFATLTSSEDPSVRCVAELKRAHVERYKQWLLERPTARGGPLHRHPSAQRRRTGQASVKSRTCSSPDGGVRLAHRQESLELGAQPQPLGQGRVTALLGGRTLRREFVVALPRRVRERLANG